VTWATAAAWPQGEQGGRLVRWGVGAGMAATMIWAGYTRYKVVPFAEKEANSSVQLE